MATGYTFDVANRLTALAHKKGASTLASSAYTLNVVGNRTSKTVEDGSKEDYAYDETDQLVGAKYTSNGALQREVSYQYDAVGNRQQVVDNTKVTTYDTNVLNQYTRVEGGSNADTSWNYTYDAQDRLVYAVKGLVNTAIKYDARNRVVSRTVTDENGTTTTSYVWDNWNLIAEYVGGVQTAKYVNGSSTDEILKKETSSETVYYHYDGLGNVVALTDTTGTVVEKYSYDAYGTPTFKSATGTTIFSSAHGNRFLFTGREYLQAHKLYDYRNRAYSPELGRFLQPDPMGFDAGDVNLYRYCGNNPINGIDPMGLECPKKKNPSNDPITRDGQLAIDDDGKGSDHGDPDHKDHTSGKLDKNGNIVPAGDTEGLNADKDSYGVAPQDLAKTPKNPDGPLTVGDKMEVTLPDGTKITTRIGDFGPVGKNGEVSVKAANDAGVKTYDKPGVGPVPGTKGSSPNIPVKVTYYPGTH